MTTYDSGFASINVDISLSQVSVLLVVLMFIFALYGVQLFGGKLARCNDHNIKVRVSFRTLSSDRDITIKECNRLGLKQMFSMKRNAFVLQENCTGVFMRPIFVTKLKLGPGPEDSKYPKILVPRVWYVVCI